jgi:hypothetical protein
MSENYKIIVSEPWDYKGPDGDNTINGIVLNVISRKIVVFRADSQLKFDSVSGDTLILSSRYVEDQDLNDLDGLTVNGGLLLDSYYNAAYAGFRGEDIQKHCKFVIIGSLRKI